MSDKNEIVQLFRKDLDAIRAEFEDSLARRREEIMTQLVAAFIVSSRSTISTDDGRVMFLESGEEIDLQNARQSAEAIMNAAKDRVEKGRDRLEEALCLVLEFHNPAPWTAERRLMWKTITGSDDASTKAMCDHIRKVLGEST